MKRMLKENKNWLLLFVSIISILLLTSCNGVEPNPIVNLEQNIIIQPEPEEGKDSYISSFFSLPNFCAGTYPDLSIGNPFAETVTPIFKRFDIIQINMADLKCVQ